MLTWVNSDSVAQFNYGIDHFLEWEGRKERLDSLAATT